MKKIKNLFKGRIGRRNYLFGLLFSALIIFALIFTIVPLYGWVLDNNNIGLTFFVLILGMIIYVIDLAFLFSLHIRRFHDIGWTGWNVIFFFIPFVNAIFVIMLILNKGDEGDNRYGAKLPKNTKFFRAIFNDLK